MLINIGPLCKWREDDFTLMYIDNIKTVFLWFCHFKSIENHKIILISKWIKKYSSAVIYGPNKIRLSHIFSDKLLFGWNTFEHITHPRFIIFRLVDDWLIVDSVPITIFSCVLGIKCAFNHRVKLPIKYCCLTVN